MDQPKSKRIQTRVVITRTVTNDMMISAAQNKGKDKGEDTAQANNTVSQLRRRMARMSKNCRCRIFPGRPS